MSLFGDLVDALLKVSFQLIKIVSMEWVFACEHLEQEGAQAPHIRLMIVEIPIDDFWRHIEWCSAACSLEFTLIHEILRQAKVSQLELEF